MERRLLFIVILHLTTFVTLAQNNLSDHKLAFANGTLPFTIPKRATLQDILLEYNYHGFGENEPTPSENVRPARSIQSPCFKTEDLNTLLTDMKEVTNFKLQPGQTKVELPPAGLPEVKNGTDCQEATAAVWTQFYRLAQLYMIMVQDSGKLTADERERLKSEYQKEKQKYQKTTDEIRQQVNEEAREQFEEMEQQLQILEKNVRDAVWQLEELKIKHKKNLVALCASEINSGNIESAKKIFEELQDQDQIYAIVYRGYKADKMENMLKFIHLLPWLSHHAMGYDALLKEVRDREDFSNLHLLTLQFNIFMDLKKNNEEKVIKESQSLLWSSRNYLLDIEQQVIKSTADRIRTNNYQDLVSYSKSEFSQNAFNMNLGKIVSAAYSTSDDHEMKIMDFSNALETIGQSARVYVDLFKLMENANHIEFKTAIKMAYKVKELMGYENYKNMGEDLKKEVDNLIPKFTPSIRAIIWGKSLCIKNVDMEIHLCDRGNYDEDRRTVGMCKYHSNPWRFDTEDETKTFRIINAEFNEYMYAANDHFVYDDSNRRVMTWRKRVPVSQGNWEIQDQDWKNGMFYIFNTAHSEYLNGDAIEVAQLLQQNFQSLLFKQKTTENVQAFTWRKSPKGPHPKWAIYSC